MRAEPAKERNEAVPGNLRMTVTELRAATTKL